MIFVRIMHFLIAEDDGVWQRLERAIVAAAGYRHTTAETWPKVVSLLRKNTFNRMIVDLSLGSDSESGLEALKFIAEKLDPPDTLVVCTHSSSKLLRDCYSLPFIKNVIPKSRIADHFEEILQFFDGQITVEKLQSIILDLGAEKMSARLDTPTAKASRETVFVVHGRNLIARREMFILLRAMGLNPLEWSDAIRLTGKGAPFNGEILDVMFHRAAAIIVLLTGDDEARLLKKHIKKGDPRRESVLTPQSRANVLFEAGMAFGRNPDRTIIVQFADLRPFSDIAGRHVLHFRGSTSDRNELATRLETAGCAVRRSGTDWLTVGKFDEACN